MHTRCVLMFVAWLCVLASLAVVGAQRECLTEGPNVRVSVNSHRNETGHWISQVTLHHSNAHQTESGSRQMKPWIVDVEHNTNRCSGTVAYDVILTHIARPPVVGIDYTFYPGIGYYKFHTNATTWPRAREICAEEGAHLVIINSEQESDVMKKLFIPYPNLPGDAHNDYVMIGILRVADTADWVTVFGEPLNLTGFTRWGPGEPKTEAIHNIAVVSRNDGSLHNWIGVKNTAFICEQEIW